MSVAMREKARKKLALEERADLGKGIGDSICSWEVVVEKEVETSRSSGEVVLEKW